MGSFYSKFKKKKEEKKENSTVKREMKKFNKKQDLLLKHMTTSFSRIERKIDICYQKFIDEGKEEEINEEEINIK